MNRFTATSNIWVDIFVMSVVGIIAEDPAKKEHILVHVPTHHAINLSCMHIMGAKECGISQRIRKFRKNAQNLFGRGSPFLPLWTEWRKCHYHFQSLISRKYLRGMELLAGGWPVGHLQSVEELNLGPPTKNPSSGMQEGGFEIGTSGLQMQRPNH